MTINELADRAGQQGIFLGKNPVRTIRYYASIGLLDRPRIEQVGRTRAAQYDDDCLDVLAVIDKYKIMGLSLETIRDMLHEAVFWSKAAAVFMEMNSPPGQVSVAAFQEGVPVTRHAVSVFMDRLRCAINCGVQRPELIDAAFVDIDGKPVVVSPCHLK